MSCVYAENMVNAELSNWGGKLILLQTSSTNNEALSELGLNCSHSHKLVSSF